MIDLPNFDDTFDYENNFYLSCESSRIAKMLTHFKFLEMTVETEGEIVECGVFKGASFSRFSMYRKILNIEHKKLIGFDTFGSFPETGYQQDKEMRKINHLFILSIISLIYLKFLRKEVLFFLV